jgi:hypothetical protein
VQPAPTPVDPPAEPRKSELALPHSDEDQRRSIRPPFPFGIELHTEEAEREHQPHRRHDAREPVAKAALESLAGPHVDDVGTQ